MYVDILYAIQGHKNKLEYKLRFVSIKQTLYIIT